MRKENRVSITVFAGCILFCVITLFYGQSLSHFLSGIRVWNWISVAEVAIGLPFYYSYKEAGFLSCLIKKSVPVTGMFCPLWQAYFLAYLMCW